MFGELAKWVRKRLHYAETLESFRVSLFKFLGSLKRPNENEHRCVIVDKVRDWKAYLSTTQKHVAGIGGPSAPRVFEMVLRSGSSASISDILNWEGVGVPFGNN
jgi:hypothetical protein